MMRCRSRTLLLPLVAGLIAACGDDPVEVNRRELAAQIVVLEGGAQVAPPGSALETEIVVEVRDAIRRRIPLVPVTFTPGQGHGTVTPNSDDTDGLGRARTRWTLGAAAGEQTLVVTADTVSITITATAGAAGAIIHRRTP